MALTAGTKLGPYEIQSPLGAGGMGDVYRARDSRLDREVAIKVLPAGLSSDASLQQRLEREARALSKLSHPHICVLHDIGHQDGVDFLVIECLEGETLDQRLRKGPLPPEQTLAYAAQLADALATAHRAGITHRDLKPSNIMLTRSGAKLMDFGLAKQSLAAQLGSAITTIDQPKLTGRETIVGTFEYMAPEQLEGKEADTRTDIFALGEIIYEMATGRPAFSGTSRASQIAAILTALPTPITQLRPLTPVALERAVSICLAKDPDERWQSASDLAGELKWIAGTPQSGVGPGMQAVPKRRRSRIPWMVAALVVAALAVVSVRLFLQPAPAFPYRARWDIGSPEKFTFHASGDGGGPVAVSPDGQRLAFSAVDAHGRQQLWVRPLDALKAEPLAGTEGAYYPFWSPDGDSIGFFANGQLKRISASGGAALPICNVLTARGGSWSKQDVIVFAANVLGPLQSVPAAGGQPATVTQLDLSQHDSHRWPYFLPDGKHFLYFAHGHDDLTGAHDGVYVASFDGKESKLVARAHTNAAFASGRLLYMNESTLMAQRFDLRRLQLTSEPVAVEGGVEVDAGYWLGVFSASQNGILAFAPAAPNSGDQLVWFGSSGEQLGTVGDPGQYQSLRLSPDGRQLAVEGEQPSHNLWIYDLERNTKSQFTLGPSANVAPVWSPDGKEIVFASDRSGHVDLYRKSLAGSEAEKVLLESAAYKFPLDWSPDGKVLLYSERSKQESPNLWALPMNGHEAARILLKSPFYESNASFSPDGRWIAYNSREQGIGQVFVIPFAGNGAKRLISAEAGLKPHWRKDGKALTYLDDSGNLLETEVDLQDSDLSPGNTRILFRANMEIPRDQGWPYDLTSNGRFLINHRSQENQTQIVVISNWGAKLKD